MDPIIRLFKGRPEVLELLGRVWDILYVEGSTPDIGRKRELFLRVLLEKEFNLKVTPAPPMERGYDFEIVIDGERRLYSVKTTETVTTVKVAWNGFPSLERARAFEFKHPILYVVGNRALGQINVYVFDLEDLGSLKSEMGDRMWWIPTGGTNPRGFGINSYAVRRLMSKAEAKGNYVSKEYSSINVAKVAKEYMDKYYELLKELALKHARLT